MKKQHFFRLPAVVSALAFNVIFFGCSIDDSTLSDAVITIENAISVQSDLKASGITEIGEKKLAFDIGYNTGKNKVSYAGNIFTDTLKSDFSTVVDANDNARPIVNEWSSGRFTWASVNLDVIASALKLDLEAGNYKMRQRNKAIGIYFDGGQDERIDQDGNSYIKEFSILAHNGAEFTGNNPFNVMLGEAADTITLELLKDDENTLLFTLTINKAELAIEAPPIEAVEDLININGANNPGNEGGLIVMAGDGEVGHSVAVTGTNKLTVTFDHKTVSSISRDRLWEFKDNVNDSSWTSAMEKARNELSGKEITYFEWAVLCNYNFDENPTLWQNSDGSDKEAITDYIFVYIDLCEIVKALNVNNKQSVFITSWCPAYLDAYPDQNWNGEHDLSIDTTSAAASEIADSNFEYVYFTKAVDGEVVRFKITFEDDSNEYFIDLDASGISIN